MNNTTNPEIQENGNVNIADEVISVIASLAASEVKGVSGMVGGISGGIAELLGKKNLSKGVKLTANEDEVTVDLSIIVEYGVKIPDVAWELQKKVKNEVEAMTGLNVVGVNISVDGVNVPKLDKEVEEEKTAAADEAINQEENDTEE
ncbi:MAG: Asp23/Gls24 family envelope stress response protein [Clostridia bacterium]|nr:Asp23/Gls24 family envelope stress response protein [Clostridia bacterium]